MGPNKVVRSKSGRLKSGSKKSGLKKRYLIRVGQNRKWALTGSRTQKWKSGLILKWGQTLFFANNVLMYPQKFYFYKVNALENYLPKYRRFPVSAIFGSRANRTVEKTALIGDWISTKIAIWDFSMKFQWLLGLFWHVYWVKSITNFDFLTKFYKPFNYNYYLVL